MSEINNTKQPHHIQISDLFKELGNDSFYISSDCVFIENSTLIKNHVYEIVEFLDNAEIKHYPIKLLHCYRKGFQVFIFAMDLTSDEFIYKKIRLGIKPNFCDWLIVDFDFFDEDEMLNETAKINLRKQLLNRKQL